MRTKHLLHNLALYTRTLRYQKPQLLWLRANAWANRVFYYNTPLYPALSDPFTPPERLLLQVPELWKGSAKTGANIAAGSFTFNARTHNFGNRISWYHKELPPHWLQQLHGFSWLMHLKAMDDDGRAASRKWLQSWFENCSQYHPLSWQPLPLSERIISWITYGPWFLEEADGDFKDFFFNSLCQQVNLLEKTLDWANGGHGLIKNLKALVYAGLALPSKQSTYLDALNLLLDQLKVQILPDGAHFERSPYFHFMVLCDMLDIHAVIRRAGHTPPPQLDEVIDRMGNALQLFCYADGKLALFNDGAVGDAKAISTVLQRCGDNADMPVQLPDAGYTRLDRGQMILLFDHGPCCPSHITRHAHADTLSFELSINSERVFVNGGTYAFEGHLRNHFRSTASHTALSVNRSNSAEVWGKSSLGRRPRHVRFTVREEPDFGIGIDASHDGYRHLGVIHHRRIFMDEDGADIRGEDFIETTSRKARQNEYAVMAQFLVHPDVVYEIKSPHEAILTTPKGVKLKMVVAGGRLYDVEAKYAPEFGVLVPARQLVVQGAWQKSGCTIKWAIKKI